VNVADTEIVAAHGVALVAMLREGQRIRARIGGSGLRRAAPGDGEAAEDAHRQRAEPAATVRVARESEAEGGAGGDAVDVFHAHPYSTARAKPAQQKTCRICLRTCGAAPHGRDGP